MDDKPARLGPRRLREHAFRGRSPLYRYLHANIEKLRADGVGHEDGPSWEAVTTYLIEEGQTNRRGEQLSVEVVKKVFGRVARDIGRKAVKPVVSEPSRVRVPPTWQPPVITRPTPGYPPPQPEVAGTMISSFRPSRGDEPVSLINKPKTEAQKLADVALTKHPRDRTPAEKIAVAQAERERRSYS